MVQRTLFNLTTLLQSELRMGGIGNSPRSSLIDRTGCNCYIALLPLPQLEA
jgi:hypothetical protein